MRILEKALIYKKEVDKNDELTFSFNVSGKLLNNSDYLNKVVSIIEQYGNKPESIIYKKLDNKVFLFISFKFK